ncbi:hypothetical protein [Flexivirga sp. B27]
MNTVKITDTELVIEPHGLDKLLSFKSGMSLPWEHVRGATQDDRIVEESKGIRGPGTRLPGKYSGTFKKDGDASFWNVGGSGSVIVVELRDEPYVRLVLSVEDPTKAVDEINAHARA